jgi:choice-of-anchor A domain-containing protein
MPRIFSAWKYFLIVVAGFCPVALHASNLGAAESFNTFIFGDINQNNIDAAGKVAAGGNVTYSNFMVGTDLTYGVGTYDLIVGGSLTGTNLNVPHGGVVIGSSNGTSKLLDPTIAGGVSTKGSLQLGQYGQIGYGGGNPFGLEVGGVFANNYNNTGAVSIYGATGNAPIAVGVDFASAQNALTQESAYLGSLAGSVPVVIYGSITATGTNPLLNVFNLSGAVLASANGLTICAPAGSTVLLNVSGTTDSLSNFQINLTGGVDDNHVLYNFYQATTITDNSVSIEGSLLAPYAAFTGNNSHINGTLIANSLSGQFEQHQDLFQGDLPSTSNAPETSTVTMLITGVCLIGVGKSRFRSPKSNSPQPFSHERESTEPRA